MTFSIEYFTRWGENLYLHCGMNEWLMKYEPEGIWTLSVKKAVFFAGEKNCRYFYEVRTDGISSRREWQPHQLDADCPDNIRDSWSDACGWHGAGTAVPVFSLRSRDSLGVGEFADIRLMVDWAVATGQSVIQLLPINDTTKDYSWKDSYPYSAVSSFALNPIYLNLPAAGYPADGEYQHSQKALNALDQLDYEAVIKFKTVCLHKLFVKCWASVSRSARYRRFVDGNTAWLLPYAVFCSLRDEYGSADYASWPVLARYDEKAVVDFVRSHRKAVNYHCFVQYLLDNQLSEVCSYARGRGVMLKGDLPIGVDRCSVDAWMYPELFNLDSQAGAPPDAFAKDGQNWGFPTYNWEEMSKDGFLWWRRRLCKMSEYFDAYRIDHLLGFFRIWEIPCQYRSGLEGHFSPALPYSDAQLEALGLDSVKVLFLEDPRKTGFWHPRINAKDMDAYIAADEAVKAAFDTLYQDYFYVRHNEFWKQSAQKKLSALIGCTAMLCCGEDLGMIPACVPDVMREMGILSLEIQRMSKDPQCEFGNPASYRYGCVCSTSTHDMNPLRAWWLEDRERTCLYYDKFIGGSDSEMPGTAPDNCEPWICEEIVRQHLCSHAMLAVLPLQDWLSLSATHCSVDPCSERINEPANPHHYWRYRMGECLEDLLSDTAFSLHLRALVEAGGRLGKL